MAARRHEAQTTRTPQAMVPAQVLPRVRCAQCGFIFFGTPGQHCEMCRASEGPHEAATAPDGPTEAAAPAPLTQALEARLAQVEHQAQALLEAVAGLREALGTRH